MKELHIQTRVFITALLPSLIIVLLLGSYMIGTRIYDTEKQLTHYGQTIVSHIARISRHGVLKNDRFMLHDIANLALEEKDLQSIAFFGSQHELLAYTGSEDFQSQEFAPSIEFYDKKTAAVKGIDSITFTAPIIINDLNLANDPDNPASSKHHSFSHKKTIGWVAINLSRTGVVLNEYQGILITTLLLSLTLLAGVLLAKQTTRHLTAPLLKIKQALKQLEANQLDTRLDVSSTTEIGDIEGGINYLAAALQQAKKYLQTGSEELTLLSTHFLAIVESQKIELAHAQKEAQEASRIKSEFIANMSHEMRTPMNSIVGFTNLLLETELSHLQRNYLTTIQKSTLNLLNLVNNILDLSRLDAGQLQLENIPFDIRDSLEDVLTIMSPLANAKQLEFTALIDNNVPQKIISDPLRFKQIIINLVSNAIKFTEQGEIIIQINLKKSNSKTATLRVTVSDTGIGLPHPDQKRIFSTFQQANTSIARKYGGTGLGLAICKKLVDQLHGKIGVKSHSGRGSVFWFTFTAESLKSEPSPLPQIDLSGRPIYLFEPHPITRAAIKNYLADWQLDMAEFADYDALYHKIIADKPSLLIFSINQNDKQLPTNTHYLSALRKEFSGPIIVLTNSCEQVALEYFLSAGATISLTKPVIRNKLYHAIFQLTYRHKIQPQLTQHSPNFEAIRVLCVDDNTANIHLVTALLHATHAKVTVAHDGDEAVHLCEKTPFDIILMDLRMSKMDGIEAVKRIRHQENDNSNVPIIALSAHISEHEYQDLIIAGFNDYLTKPVTKNILFNKINQWIKHTDEPTTPPLSTSPIGPTRTIDPSMPVVDWVLGLKLANHKQDLANDMITLLKKSLQTDLGTIRQTYAHQTLDELYKEIHKLHGAVCYCGVPRLKIAIELLETALKQENHDELPSLFQQFEAEAEALLAAETVEAQ